MGTSPTPPGYASLATLEARFIALARQAGGSISVAGRSREGRPITRLDLGPAGAPAVLLTGLLHGNEAIGAMALLEVLRQVVADPWLGQRLRFTVLPVANPDAFAANLARLARGERAHQRGNAAGVDLNRNFPRIPGARSWHPFSGSAWRRSPHYAGPHALSEPEARAVVETAAGASPRLALGFHSFGELLLYPWAHTAAPNPRVADYMALGRAFRAGQGSSPWRVGPSWGFYPVIGDLDDFLDAELGTLAFTVEVGRPSARLLLSRAALNPFWWMNAPDAEGALAAVVPGVMSLLRAVELAPQADPHELPKAPREDLPGSCRAPGLPTRPLSASAPTCSDV